jgi:hypothetical protein
VETQALRWTDVLSKYPLSGKNGRPCDWPFRTVPPHKKGEKDEESEKDKTEKGKKEQVAEEVMKLIYILIS